MKHLGDGLAMLPVQAAAPAQGQSLFDVSQAPSVVLGWAGFQDTRFIVSSLAILLLATVLGAIDRLSPRDAAHDRQAA